MDISKEKQWIKEEIDKTDDDVLLRAVRSLIDLAKEKQDQLEPLTVDDLISRAKAAEEAIADGRVTDIDSFEKDSLQW